MRLRASPAGQATVKTKKFNINEYVWVKLNPEGHKIYLAYYEAEFKDVPNKYRRNLLAVDDDGYSCFQLWEFMRIFGRYLYMGCDPPFDSTVKFDSKQLTD